MNKYLLFIIFVLFFIHGCYFNNKIEKNIIKKKNLIFCTKKLNFTPLNFDLAIENIVSEILKSNNILTLKKTLFLIDLLENNTNIFIDIEKLTDLIKNKFSKKNKKIFFIKKDMIKKSKKKLGILNTKNTLDISTALLLSRNNNIKYYLRGSISGQNEPYLLKIELILVKTGEIVFMQQKKIFSTQ